MKTKGIDNAKVGLFVLAGVSFLILLLYMIGRNRNLLGSTFTVKAVINNVNGLVPGNNVRFRGIDVGTVKSINIENDTAIYVVMIIDNKMKPYIKKNALASIGTDGLMGNKLLNINTYAGDSEPLKEGDVIGSRKPIETDEMLRTLNTTNNNIEKITTNLYEITVKLNSSKSLWSLLSDTVITKDLKKAVFDFRVAGSNTASMTKKGKELATRLENGNGLADKIFTDTVLVQQLAASLQEIKQASDQASFIMQDLKTVVGDMKQGEGTAGLLLTDTVLREKLMHSVQNIEEGTGRFNENMEALKSNFLFRKYFKKQAKAEKEKLKQNAKARK